MMGRKFTHVNEAFICHNCGFEVQPSASSCRNHCPKCLHSVHVDNFPGDRSADCGGLMTPIAVVFNTKKGYQVLHKCNRCGKETKNILDFDAVVQPDSLDVALGLMKSGLHEP
jgi:DNA-directed RNA polymerase subunit RPC12/RpoP